MSDTHHHVINSFSNALAKRSEYKTRSGASSFPKHPLKNENQGPKMHRPPEENPNRTKSIMPGRISLQSTPPAYCSPEPVVTCSIASTYDVFTTKHLTPGPIRNMPRWPMTNSFSSPTCTLSFPPMMTQTRVLLLFGVNEKAPPDEMMLVERETSLDSWTVWPMEMWVARSRQG